jgi:hypothetical protein
MSSYIIRHDEGLGLYAMRRKGLNESLEIYVSAEMWTRSYLIVIKVR